MSSSLETSDYHSSLLRLLEITSSPRLGLGRMQQLLQLCGNPQDSFESFHIAGTNGKGSVCAFLYEILRKAGVRVGMTTSPHLTSARERIQFQGRLISEDEFCAAENVVFEAVQKMEDPPTFFERIVAMAFWTFQEQKINIAVVEVGLGGRLDATNVLQRPLAVGVSPIGIDHRNFLGETIEEIAGEKAGIIKEERPVVCGKQEPIARDVIRSVALEKRAPFVSLDDASVFQDVIQHLSLTQSPHPLPHENRIGLLGKHQLDNAVTAALMVEHSELSISQDVISAGLCQTTWPGRFERISSSPPVFLDGAHNAAAANELTKSLRDHPSTKGKPIFLIWGATRGHDVKETAQAFDGPIAQCWAVQSQAPRSMSADMLAACLAREFSSQVSEASVKTALREACAGAEARGGIVVVTGSLYLVGEVRAHFVQMATDPSLPEF